MKLLIAKVYFAAFLLKLGVLAWILQFNLSSLSINFDFAIKSRTNSKKIDSKRIP